MEKLTLKTISFKDLWNVFRGCFLFVIVASVLVTGLMFVRAKATYSPMYSSSGTLYLINKNTGNTGEGDATNEWTINYTLANVVIEDTMYLLKSRTVLNAVGDAVGIKNGYGALKNNIKIVNPEDTRVLEITVTASSPELAKNIVDQLSVIGPEKVNEELSYGSIRVYEEGTYSNWAINQVSLMSYLKFGIFAGILVYAIFLCMFLFDNYIHTEDDIERCLGISIIGDIPDADAAKKKNKYKKYNKRANKSYYGAAKPYSTYGAYTNKDGKKE